MCQFTSSLQASLSKGCMNLLFSLWMPNITPTSLHRERINCTLITNHIVMYQPNSHIIALSEFKSTASLKQQIIYHCKYKTICCIRNSTKESGVVFFFLKITGWFHPLICRNKQWKSTNMQQIIPHLLILQLL